MKVALKAFEDELDKTVVNEQDGLTKPAKFIFELLEKCQINLQNKEHFFDILQRLLQYFGSLPANPRRKNIEL